MTLANYDDTLNYIFGLKGSGIHLGLENTASLLRHFGDPQLKVPTVHIAGTNGKGSTAAFIESILRHAGHRVGLFTTPHLADFRERVQLNRTLIPQTALIDLSERIREAGRRLDTPLTYFEFGVVLAFLYFHEAGASWNVIEVGLGGRLDATNLVRPEVALIPSIGLDHGDYLGFDVAGIAREKSFIIKENGTVFAHVEDTGAFTEIARRAREVQARLFRFGADFDAARVYATPEGQCMDFRCGETQLKGLETALIGTHQVTNAALACAAALWLGGRHPEINEAAIRTGLKTARWPGRLEVVSSQPWLVLDAAHNPDGVRKLTQAVREIFTFDRLILVAGIMKDKPVDTMLEALLPLAGHILFTRPDQERAESPDRLANRLRQQPGASTRPVETVAAVGQAVARARELARSSDLILVTGSIFTVAEARQSLIHDTTAHSHPFDRSRPRG
jgi:dihydrofolate synthase/folylpolyglutamate synthase